MANSHIKSSTDGDLQSGKKSWFAEPNLGRRKTLLIAATFAVGLTAISRTKIGESLTANVARGLEYQLRDAFGAPQTLSPRLKIFVQDDKTIQVLGRSSLTNGEWAKVIHAINQARPAKIIIDQIFLAPPHDAGLSDFLKELRAGAPVVAGSFNSQVESVGIKMFGGKPDHDIKRLLKGTSQKIPANWLKSENPFTYGPAPELEPGFRHVGHLMTETFGYFKPFIAVGQSAAGSPTAAIPHIALYAGENYAVADNHLIADWQPVPIDERGRILTNFHDQKFFGSQLKSLVTLFTAAKRGEAPDSIVENDVVFIAPSYYTGNTDFKETVIGTLPGALLIASMINSVLTKEWLIPIGPDWLFITLSSLLGAFLGFKLSGNRFWLGLASCIVVLASLSLSLFAFVNIVLPWSFSSLALFLTGITTFTEKSREAEKKALHLRLSFKNMMGADHLKSITDNPEKLEVAAAQRLVSVMFIDVVGFSIYSESRDPGTVFSDLKELILEITTVIHEFGGVIDKTLGDGVLAFFGYRYDGSATDTDHADRAVRCAVEIQRRILTRNLEATKHGRAIHPLRIGINSESVYIGNLGAEDRVDFTIIGNGVNFAKRIEEACEIYRVMFSETTREMLTDPTLINTRIEPRLIMIKHHSHPIEVCELNPFANDSEKLQMGLQEYWRSLGISKREVRMDLPENMDIDIFTRFGRGKLHDLSLSGLSFQLDRYLAKGIELEFELDNANGSLKADLQKQNLLPLLGQMRWGTPLNNSYMHGLIIKNLNHQQKELLFAILSRHIHKAPHRVA